MHLNLIDEGREQISKKDPINSWIRERRPRLSFTKKTSRPTTQKSSRNSADIPRGMRDRCNVRDTLKKSRASFVFDAVYVSPFLFGTAYGFFETRCTVGAKPIDLFSRCHGKNKGCCANIVSRTRRFLLKSFFPFPFVNVGRIPTQRSSNITIFNLLEWKTRPSIMLWT